MEEKKNFLIKKMDGTQEEVEVIVVFQFNDSLKEYMVYTKNEIDTSGNITIYVSEVTRDNSGIKLGGVATEEEWARIKDVLRELSKKAN